MGTESPLVCREPEVGKPAIEAIFRGRIVLCRDVSLTRNVACPLIRLSRPFAGPKEGYDGGTGGTPGESCQPMRIRETSRQDGGVSRRININSREI